MALGRTILKYSFKKHAELLAMIYYLEDRITGDELIGRFNMIVEEGTRAGKIYKLSLPHRRSEGLKVARQLSARKAGISQ